MHDQWGNCKQCHLWQIAPDAKTEDSTIGHCLAAELAQFNLQVSGLSGCNHFVPGEPQLAHTEMAVLVPDQSMF